MLLLSPSPVLLHRFYTFWYIHVHVHVYTCIYMYDILTLWKFIGSIRSFGPLLSTYSHRNGWLIFALLFLYNMWESCSRSSQLHCMYIYYSIIMYNKRNVEMQRNMWTIHAHWICSKAGDDGICNNNTMCIPLIKHGGKGMLSTKYPTSSVSIYYLLR